jgi:hypothetical protein
MRKLKSLAFAIALTAASAFAQPDGLRADIPFEFHAADTVMPAGTYYVVVDASASRVELRGDSGAVARVFTHQASRLGSEERSSLLFHRYGSKYFLRLVSSAGRSQGFELPVSSVERESAKSNTGFVVALLHSK